jgi:hypothetical protein
LAGPEAYELADDEYRPPVADEIERPGNRAKVGHGQDWSIGHHGTVTSS